jgi:hypothetical protein
MKAEISVFLRFRREMIAVTADVQHMFHCFIVREDHRNYLRFLWYKDNDLETTANTNVPHSLVMVEQLPHGCCPVSYP